MTIDEAIKHCLEVVENNVQFASGKWIGAEGEAHRQDCLQCAADHRQLAEWLKELKELKSTYIKSIHIGHWIEHNDCIECSVCGFEVKDPYCEKRDMICTETSYDHCPKCGSDMREQDEVHFNALRK